MAAAEAGVAAAGLAAGAGVEGLEESSASMKKGERTI